LAVAAKVSLVILTATVTIRLSYRDEEGKIDRVNEISRYLDRQIVPFGEEARGGGNKYSEEKTGR